MKAEKYNSGAFIIRPMQPRQLAAVNALKLAVIHDTFVPLFPVVARGLTLYPHWPYENFCFWKDALLAMDGAAVIGIARSKGTWLTDLWIAKDWRGRGVGRALLKAAENKMRQHGVRMAHLRTPVKNSPAIAFYRGRGWRIEKQILHETRLDFGFVFIKRL